MKSPSCTAAAEGRNPLGRCHWTTRWLLPVILSQHHWSSVRGAVSLALCHPPERPPASLSGARALWVCPGPPSAFKAWRGSMDGKRGQGGVVMNLGRICTALPLPESWGEPGTCTSSFHLAGWAVRRPREYSRASGWRAGSGVSSERRLC